MTPQDALDQVPSSPHGEGGIVVLERTRRFRRSSASVVAVALFATAPARATYSIAAADRAAQQVGGAVTSCVGAEGVTVVYGAAPGHGGINSQAAASIAGRNRGVALLDAGMAPVDIIAEISAPTFDPDYDSRQYGIADLQGRAAGFTGTGAEVARYREDRQGRVGSFAYSIQGNVLTGVRVIDQAEAAFKTKGCDLAEKLMLALEAGAENGQGDSRCTTRTPSIPSDAASIEVDLAGQPVGSYLRLSVAGTSPANPLVQLRSMFNDWRATHPCPINTDGGGPPDASHGGGAACGCRLGRRGDSPWGSVAMALGVVSIGRVRARRRRTPKSISTCW